MRPHAAHDTKLEVDNERIDLIQAVNYKSWNLHSGVNLFCPEKKDSANL